MRQVVLLTFIVCFLPGASYADDLTGRYAFRNDVEPTRTHCIRVGADLSHTFSSPTYHCEKTNTDSGKATSCSTKKGAGYLVFQSLATCESERKNEGNAE